MLWNVRKENSIYIYIVRTLETLYFRHCVQGMSKFVRFLPCGITVFLRESRLVMRWNREGIHPIWSESGKWKLDSKVRLIIGNPV